MSSPKDGGESLRPPRLEAARGKPSPDRNLLQEIDTLKEAFLAALRVGCRHRIREGIRSEREEGQGVLEEVFLHRIVGRMSSLP
jgi:hypothetical protein